MFEFTKETVQDASSTTDTWSTAGTLDHPSESSMWPKGELAGASHVTRYQATMDLLATCLQSDVPIWQATEREGSELDGAEPKTLGHGASGEVAMGIISQHENRLVAFKRFRVSLSSTGESGREAEHVRMLREAKMEIIAMSNQVVQSYPGICKVLGLAISPMSKGFTLGLLLELAYCSLEKFLVEKMLPNETDRMGLVTGIARGLYSLHLIGIIHGDLKPSNCLVFKPLEGPPIAKLSDFGLARSVTDGSQSHSGPAWGTWFWAAPECLDSGTGTARPTMESDMFSLGMLAVETIFDLEKLDQFGWPSFRFRSRGHLGPSEFEQQKRNGGLAAIAGQLASSTFFLANGEHFPSMALCLDGKEEHDSVTDRKCMMFTSIEDGIHRGKVSIGCLPTHIPSQLSYPSKVL
jgi:serine/threonine protein kinase